MADNGEEIMNDLEEKFQMRLERQEIRQRVKLTREADAIVEEALEREARARRSNALEAGMQLAQEALTALEDSSWDKAAAFSAAATAQFVFAMTPVLENDFDIEV